ncbi:uncharacterized protein LOC119101224 isoform X2 [Pollicipes pollicipes]|nr:uncharacterized protein LOC119101224 isoform X2 [Pollicipes pollicipes]
MRDALEGLATGSDAHQRTEPSHVLDKKNNRLGDLTNQLNKLRAATAQKRQKLASIMVTFKESVVDNIMYEENRQPEAVHLRQLNNHIDCVSKKLLEAEHVRDKYRRVIASLRNEQTTYRSRLQLLRERVAAAAGSRATVQQAEQYARSVCESAQQQLQDSQQLSSQWRHERDAVLAQHKRQAEQQRSEYQQLRRQLYLGGADNPLPIMPSHSAVMTARRVSELVDAQLAGLYQDSKHLIDFLGARTIEDVVKLFEMQSETSRQLSMVWKDAESNIKQLKIRKQELELEQEKLKYADNIEETRTRARCAELRRRISGHEDRRELAETRTAEITRSLTGMRTSLVHMVDLFQDAGVSLLKLPMNDAYTAPGLSDLFNAVSAAVQFVMQPLEAVNVSQMMIEMDAEDFFASKSEQLALDTKVRGIPPIKPPGKKRFSFLLVDRPDVIDEGPNVPTRAQMKRHAQIVLEARTRKIRAPTAREQRRARRRSTIVDRPLQAMS